MYVTLITFAYLIGIAGLFWLNHRSEERTSKALWIPVIWLLVNGSRPISAWLAQLGLAAPLAGDVQTQYLDGSPIDRFVYIVLLIVGIVALSTGNRRIGSLLRNNIVIIVFFTYCAVSVVWSDFPFVALKRWSKSIGDPIMVMIILTDLGGAAALKRVFSRVGFVLIPLSVLLTKYYPDLSRSYNQWTYLPSYTGVTLTKNLLGMLCLVFGLGCLWCFLTAWKEAPGKERHRRLIAHGVILLMTFWLFRMSDSVTSMSCFAVAAMLMLLVTFSETARKPLALHFLTVSMLIVPCLGLLSSGIIESLGRDPSLTGRTGIWDAVLSVSGSPLVGTGFESFWLGDRLQKVWDMTMFGLQEAHNGYLEVYLNLGYVGVGLIILMLLVGYRHVIAEFRRDPTAGSLRLAFFVAAVIYSLSEAGFRETTLTWTLLLFAITTIPVPAPEQVPVSPISRFAQLSRERRLTVGARLQSIKSAHS
jgi:exopolysaccharide production protein ExoQ